MDVLKEIKSLSGLIGEDKSYALIEQVEVIISNSETLVNRVNVLEEEIEDLEDQINDLEKEVSDLREEIDGIELSDFDTYDIVDYLESKGYSVSEVKNTVSLDYLDSLLLEGINRLFYEGNFEQRQIIYDRVKNTDEDLLNCYLKISRLESENEDLEEEVEELKQSISNLEDHINFFI